jgi:hypothetical protein
MWGFARRLRTVSMCCGSARWRSTWCGQLPHSCLSNQTCSARICGSCGRRVASSQVSGCMAGGLPSRPLRHGASMGTASSIACSSNARMRSGTCGCDRTSNSVSVSAMIGCGRKSVLRCAHPQPPLNLLPLQLTPCRRPRGRPPRSFADVVVKNVRWMRLPRGASSWYKLSSSRHGQDWLLAMQQHKRAAGELAS